MDDPGKCPHCGGESDGSVLYSCPLATRCKACGQLWHYGEGLKVFTEEEARARRPGIRPMSTVVEDVGDLNLREVNWILHDLLQMKRVNAPAGRRWCVSVAVRALLHLGKCQIALGQLGPDDGEYMRAEATVERFKQLVGEAREELGIDVRPQPASSAEEAERSFSPWVWLHQR